MNAQQTFRELVTPIFALTVIVFASAQSAAAQDIFGGQGIRAPGSSSNSMFNSQRGTVAPPKSKNPFAGLFKKPAFLNGPDGPKLEMKLPKFDFFNKLKPPGVAAGESNSLFAGMPKLQSLFPKRAPGEPSMLQKMKAKTDSFFDRAFKFEGLLPGLGSRDEPKWEDVRNTLEKIQAKNEQNQQPLSPPVRSARTPTGQTQRF
jgi:hypothetical protein